MLTDAKKKELLVLYTIVQSAECSLQELSQILSIPKRTIKEIIRKLNGTILQQLEIQRFIHSTAKGEIKVDDCHQDEKMAVFYYIKLLFLRESNRFNFLMVLFDSPNHSVSKKLLLEKLYISPSYLEKLTNQLNQSLEKFHLKIISRQNCYILKGNELSLRIYIYLFFSDAFQGIDWPLTSIKFSQAKKSQLSNELLIPKRAMKLQEQVYLLVAIFLMRSSHHPLEDNQSNVIYEIMRILKQTKDFTGELKKQLPSYLPENFVHNEVLFFNFLLCYFFPNLISEQQKTLFGYEFSKSNHSLCRQVSLLVKKLTEYFPTITAVEKKYYYHYLIMMLTAFILLFEEKIDYFYTLYFPNMSLKNKEPDSQLENIQELIASIFSTHPKKELFIKHLSQLIDTLLKSEEKKKLTIHLQIHQTIVGNYHIRNRLKRIFNDQFLQLTENPEEADLIITDSFDSQHQTAEVFYFDENREDDLWNSLLHFIRKLHQS
ncbi:ribonuclease P protein component [Enterococcus villorum]|uniref:Ribonuclease P protein component n=1 Tax=Enterococcus villorum TaxID=112904 RepID=A0A1V8YR41_9ENTE|nr:helix-turn-helix domain-containing protein [Enterococcus villorum]OQO70806.1 ribonuclease P protein component [Enterococcus villorum]OQO75113.1 ribonuclease P protein component [Enterococcus villorum]